MRDTLQLKHNVEGVKLNIYDMFLERSATAKLSLAKRHAFKAITQATRHISISRNSKSDT